MFTADVRPTYNHTMSSVHAVPKVPISTEKKTKGSQSPWRDIIQYSSY